MKKEKLTKFLLGLSSLVLLTCCSLKSDEPRPATGNPFNKKFYTNPVIDRSVPDPTVIRADNGKYYLYGTEDIHNVPIFTSDDMVNWNLVGTAFDDTTRPNFYPTGMIWAPDIQKIDGKYLLYYSLATDGSTWDCGIGVAVSDKPEGPFSDKGKIFTSSEIGVEMSIDPVIYIEDGRNWLFWGSFRGIYGIEMSSDGLTVKPGAQKFKIAGNLTEGTNIWKQDGKYYLIGSAGNWYDASYRVVMARADRLEGPYLDREGRSALDGNMSDFLKGNGKTRGPGHNANFVSDDAGQLWMLYHGWNLKGDMSGRRIYLDKVTFGEDGWPQISTGEPSETAEYPVIDK